MSNLKLTDIGRSYGPVEIIASLDLEVQDGEFVVFVGPSGCGKSTLLRIIAGLDQPDRGTVEIDGRDVTSIPAAERGLAMVFQSYALYPHMSVKQNLSFGLENSRLDRGEIEARVADAARMLQIEALLTRKPGQLSGGQRQRVAIGRSIVRRPGIFLLDEPLSNLDAELRVVMRAELSALQKRLKATMIYVTHDQVEAMTLADRIVVLRKGHVEQTGAPLDLYNRPANRFVAGFIGSPQMNFFTGAFRSADSFEVEGGEIIALGKSFAGAKAGVKATLGVRPQHMLLADHGISAQIILVEALGSETIIHAKTATQDDMIVSVSGQQILKAGETIHMLPQTDQIHVFDETGLRWAGT